MSTLHPQTRRENHVHERIRAIFGPGMVRMAEGLLGESDGLSVTSEGRNARRAPDEVSLAAGALLRNKIVSLVVEEKLVELVACHRWRYFQEKSAASRSYTSSLAELPLSRDSFLSLFLLQL